jgi:FtsP/CotA-like multicopper oxidase with cupredoxin domain
MPGPPVVVCKDDKVIIDVLNAMQADTTSLHFHGKLYIAKMFKLMVELIINKNDLQGGR